MHYNGSWALYTLSEINIALTKSSLSGTTTNGSRIVTGLSDTSQMVVGMKVSGTNIPALATVSSINSATQITLSANATGTGTVNNLVFKTPAGTVYDVFCFANSGTPKLEMVAWSSTTARATALTMQDGVYCKNGDTTRRYLGSFATSSTDGQSEDSGEKRLLFNYCNRVARYMERRDNATSWNLPANMTTWRNANDPSTSNALNGFRPQNGSGRPIPRANGGRH
jgi:hypothetical protein